MCRRGQAYPPSVVLVAAYPYWDMPSLDKLVIPPGAQYARLTPSEGTLRSCIPAGPRAHETDRPVSSSSQVFRDGDVREFIRLWREEFGETLSPEEADRQATLLLELYLHVYDGRGIGGSSGDAASNPNTS